MIDHHIDDVLHLSRDYTDAIIDLRTKSLKEEISDDNDGENNLSKKYNFIWIIILIIIMILNANGLLF